ncbi:MAG: acyl-CoA dehydrogenase family protein [Hyphomicrobiales bacterium]|nr:acyl-CoA dehydrogenase family protein [Hyphomicrobiales bacterium]
MSDHEINIQPDPDWKDILGIEDDLTTEEKLVQKTAYDYSSQELFPRVKEAFKNEIFDKSIINELGKLGLIAPTISTKYGGSELNNVCYGLIAYEIEKVDSGYRSVMSVQSSLVIHPIYEFGSEKQKSEYIPELIKGNLIGCFGLTEPNHGSDPSSMQTTARKVDRGWSISGTKTWITNAPIADIAIIWAKTDENILRGFILDRNKHDFATAKIDGKFSLRTSETGEIHMDETFISDDCILPNVVGLKGPFSCLNKARYGIAWGTIGSAEFCWHSAREYALNRNQFNRPIASNQLIQKDLVDFQTQITLGKLAVLKLGREMDKRNINPAAISLMKRNNCQIALDIARKSRDILGGNGISNDYHIIRHLLNLETVNTYEGTANIHTLILGRSQTGIQAFS